ncbi:MAG: adenylosuccinate synthase [Planctomycetota bacterium]|nr:adenylosuccinate synthase [Planctomycetota bacterium]
MSGISVIGLQWGDEAKGKLVDLLTKRSDIVVRYQGGANAGHTIVDGTTKYVVHHVPSGILNPTVINVVSPGVVLNPKTLIEEIEAVTSQGVKIGNRLMLSERTHVVLPWHVAEDLAWNEAITGEKNIGTTLRGIGPCYRDKVGRTTAIQLGDLYRSDFAEKVHSICRLKKAMLAGFNGKVDPALLDADKIIDDYQAFADQLSSYVCDTTSYLLDAVEENKRILFEGAQGSLLDIDHGTYPFVTSSNSSGVGISAGSGIPPRWIEQIVGVAKCYSTRVGGGPFPTELENETGDHIRKMGNEFGTTTGRPRRCGWFDAVAVRYTSRLSGISGLAMMMLDVLSELEEINICIEYEIEGKRISTFPAHADDLAKVQPVYETLPGWQADITSVENYEDLPENAKNYVQRISDYLGIPIEVISVGPDRKQTIPVGHLLKTVESV